jgi:hypothetical protein
VASDRSVPDAEEVLRADQRGAVNERGGPLAGRGDPGGAGVGVGPGWGEGWASPSSGAERVALCECGSPAGSERACGLCGRPQPSFPGWRLRPDRGEGLSGAL